MFLFTGQVLSRENIKQVIKFAKEENLFVLADEVIDSLIVFSLILYWKNKTENK